MLNATALRFLAFLPEGVAAGDDGGPILANAVAKLADEAARHDPGLRLVPSAAGFALWVATGPVNVPVVTSSDGDSCSVGWMFTDARPGSSIGRWGGYITFAPDRQGRVTAARSVDGLMTACAVRTHGGTIVASQMPAWLLRAAGVAPDVDWNVIAAVLGDPTLTGHRSALRGVVIIPPGCRLETHRSGTGPADVQSVDALRIVPTWDPGAIAAAAGTMSPTDAEERLREAVDETVGAWAGVADGVLVELSGGLDSSILAGTLSRLEPDRRITLVNASTSQAGGDERRYARDVAELCGRPLVEIAADERVLDVASLRRLVHPSEPILYGLDAGHDAQMAEQARSVGAQAIVTGQGGDAIFYQMPDLAIAVDSFRLRGWQSLLSKHTRDVVRRAQRSVWSAWAAILADQFGRSPGAETYPAPMTTRAAMEHATTRIHPWLAGLRDLPPAKARQVQAITHSQIFYGPTQRGRSTLFVHPLLSQPVVEACLSIPVPILTGGRFDRQRARAAFGDRLPPSVALRHSKGEAASHYNLAVTAAVEELRSLLLDGRLVGYGLLDQAALDQALRPETLLWSDLSRPLIVYASIEAWVRYWENA